MVQRAVTSQVQEQRAGLEKVCASSCASWTVIGRVPLSTLLMFSMMSCVAIFPSGSLATGILRWSKRPFDGLERRHGQLQQWVPDSPDEGQDLAEVVVEYDCSGIADFKLAQTSLGTPFTPLIAHFGQRSLQAFVILVAGLIYEPLEPVMGWP